jgi:hypothetical protein
MDNTGKIIYSVLDLSNNQATQTAGKAEDQENDKHFWSNVDFNNSAISTLQFPKEIAQVGYGVVPHRLVGNYSDISTVINDSDTVTIPDSFYSTTARLGAIAPFQALSDGKYIYIFRQSVAAEDANNIKTKDNDPIVNSTLLVDRFILSGTVLKLSREVRYQRSRHKTQPASRKDTLSATDVEGRPFYEPTRELAFVANLANSNFSVLLIPGADTEEQRWQLFSHDAVTNKLNSFNIRFDDSIVFDTSDTQTLIDAFLKEYELDAEFIAEVQSGIVNNQTDEEIAKQLLSQNPYKDSDRTEQGMQVIPEDALTEIIYTIRTGVSKDDCIPASVSEWPLYVKNDPKFYIEGDTQEELKTEYTFQEQGDSAELQPQSTNFTIANGLSSCYYYQQEMDATNQPMKTKAAVMLAMGLEYIDSDGDTFKYIGIFNFSVNGQGQLSRLTKDIVDLPDIDVQALDENPYETLEKLLDGEGKPVGWQQPQQMSLLDIDTNGLSTSGGVLKFAYTGADQAEAEKYSDATEASFPYVFDDSLGRVNLYLKGKNDNFFVLYFSPNGSKSLEVTDQNSKVATPVLSLKPRLDRDINVRVQVAINTDSNTCTLSMLEDGRDIEVWSQLPKQLPQIANILNGQGKLPLGTLVPLGNEEDTKAGYLDGNETVKMRTTVDNNLMFNEPTAYASALAAGAAHTVNNLEALSAYLNHHKSLNIANKTFELQDQSIIVEAEVLYKSYLSGLVETSEDIDTLWGYLKDSYNSSIDLIQEIPEAEIINTATTTTINEGATFSATDTTLSVTSVEDLGIEQGDYLIIGSEILRVEEIYGNDLEVSRGQLSTVAVAHSNGSTVTHAACLLNGTLNEVAQSLTLTSTATLGVVRGDTLKIDNEVLRVESVSGNRLSVTRGVNDSTGTATTATVHTNGAIVQLHQKGAPNSKAHLKEAVLIGTKTTLTNLMTDASITSLDLDLLQEGNEADIANRLVALQQKLTDLLLEVAKVRILQFTVTDTNTESVDRLEAGLQVEVSYDTTHFTCTPQNLAGISTTVWEHPRSYLFNASIEQNYTPTKTIINQEGFDSNATTLTVSSVTTLGIEKDEYLQIDEEVVKVTEIQESTHQLTVTRGQLGTTATTHDNRATVTHYPCWIDANLTSTATSLTVTSAQALGIAVGDFLQIEDEVLLVDAIDSDTQLSVTRQQKGSTAAAHTQGTGMYIHSRGTLEIDNRYDYTYVAKNAIGQWEDWEASLAMEFTPSSATSGALLTTTTSEKLSGLNPTKLGLSAEAWIKPKEIIGSTGATSIILYHKNDGDHYSLGIEKVNDTIYQCFATLGTNKYTIATNYPFRNSQNKEVWKHIAFTHQKYWGYQLASNQTINCGDSDSLHLNDEFSLEVLVKVDNEGTLLKKEGEFVLAVEDTSVTFKDPSANRLANNDLPFTMGSFVKITLIRSKNKPQTAPSIAEYPITGGDAGSGNSSDKWYENKDTDEIIEGMAEKQDQLEQQMDVAQFNMLGNTQDQQVESNPSYYHTLIITNQEGTSTEWQTSKKEEVTMSQAFKEFALGGNGFAGTFDSVRIWNRALSTGDAKIWDLPENKAGLIAHWRMEEGEGKYLYDNIGEHHGVSNVPDVASPWVGSPRTNQQGQFQFYIDGARVSHELEENYSVPSNDSQFSLAGYTTGTNKAGLFKGTLEEIRIWNQARSHEEITDNVFGRLKGEWDQLLANYTFDRLLGADNIVLDASTTTVNVSLVDHTEDNFKQVLSTAPVATEIPQIRSALTGALTPYQGTIQSRPQVVEYGDVQKNEDGTLNGILKRCYSFIDKAGKWNRMTGYKVGNLVSQWYTQAQFAPQVMGYLEGPPPVPAENFPVGEDSVIGKADIDTYAYILDNSIAFNQAEEVSYNYSSSKEAGWNLATEGDLEGGLANSLLIAPMGFGLSLDIEMKAKAVSNWETSGTRSESYERGVAVNTNRSLSAGLAGYDNGGAEGNRYYSLGNTGYALVKSKTADIYLLRLAHNNALVSISWQPNPDIPEDVNIIPFPINPLYTKQGVLDGKFGDTTDDHYPQAQGAYGEYSYFKPREAYRLKKKIEREKATLQSYFEDSFDVSKTNGHFAAVAATTGVVNSLLNYMLPGAGPAISSIFNQTAGQLATQVGYNNTQLKEDLAAMGSQRNLANTYVWTIEGGFYAESTEVTETQQETFASETSLSLSGSLGWELELEGGAGFTQTDLLTTGSSFTLTKSKTKESSTSFGLDVSVDIPTSPRYKYGGTDGRSLVKGLISPGTVDAYRFMSFYLEPKGKNFTDLFTEVIDPIWLAQNPDPNAQALRQAAGNIDKAKPCWRILHRVTYVSRILPEFTAEAPPSLEKATRVAGFESNYGLIKRFEPYLKDMDSTEDFFNTIETIINTQLPEFKAYKQEVKEYLALYFNMDMN